MHIDLSLDAYTHILQWWHQGDAHQGCNNKHGVPHHAARKKGLLALPVSMPCPADMAWHEPAVHVWSGCNCHAARLWIFNSQQGRGPWCHSTHLWLLSWLLLCHPNHFMLPIAVEHHLTGGALTGLRQAPEGSQHTWYKRCGFL